MENNVKFKNVVKHVLILNSIAAILVSFLCALFIEDKLYGKDHFYAVLRNIVVEKDENKRIKYFVFG